jgi:hypothetical protein
MAQESTQSLHPLKFDEAITDLLKIKPMPKPPKKQKQAKATGKAKLRKSR